MKFEWVEFFLKILVIICDAEIFSIFFSRKRFATTEDKSKQIGVNGVQAIAEDMESIRQTEIESIVEIAEKVNNNDDRVRYNIVPVAFEQMVKLLDKSKNIRSSPKSLILDFKCSIFFALSICEWF